MRLSETVLSTRKIRVPVEAFAVLLVFFSLSAKASTGTDSSWSNQPSWAAPSDNNSDDSNNNNGNTGRSRKKATTSNYASATTPAPFAPGSNNVALDVGQVFLLGQMGNNYADSIGYQAHYTYGVSDLFGFDSSLGYSSHSDGQFSMLSALTGIRINMAYYDKVVPYTILGLGFYKPAYTVSSTDGGAPTTSSSVLFGLHAGAGVDLLLTKSMFFGASITLHDVFGSDQQVANSTQSMGGTYASFLIHAGTTF
jgi:hypothetical protein